MGPPPREQSLLLPQVPVPYDKLHFFRAKGDGNCQYWSIGIGLTWERHHQKQALPPPVGDMNDLKESIIKALRAPLMTRADYEAGDKASTANPVLRPEFEREVLRTILIMNLFFGLAEFVANAGLAYKLKTELDEPDIWAGPLGNEINATLAVQQRMTSLAHEQDQLGEIMVVDPNVLAPFVALLQAYVGQGLSRPGAYGDFVTLTMAGLLYGFIPIVYYARDHALAPAQLIEQGKLSELLRPRFRLLYFVQHASLEKGKAGQGLHFDALLKLEPGRAHGSFRGWLDAAGSLHAQPPLSFSWLQPAFDAD